MTDKGDGVQCDQSSRVLVKSFAEITSCHTINISACSRGDNDEKGVVTNDTTDNSTSNNRGTKRQRNEENGVNRCKKSETNIYSLPFPLSTLIITIWQMC